MEQTSMTTEIPSALPDIEETDLRESLLEKENQAAVDGSSENEDEELEDELPEPQPKRLGKWIRTGGAFLVFLVLLVFGMGWFFGIGWFSKTKPEVVQRNAQKNSESSPQSEDEKLKIALNMVAAKEPQVTNEQLVRGTEQILPDTTRDESSLRGRSDLNSNVPTVQVPDSSAVYRNSSVGGSRKDESDLKDSPTNDTRQRERVNTKANESEPPGRSVFFGISERKPSSKSIQNDPPQGSLIKTSQVERRNPIPFGTLLPVRLTGSIYTLRTAGGYVRMELTRPIEGKGYKYPAGTQLVGNVRGGESTRAFVAVVGLIDPASGEFVKFSGDLLGSDGASGVEGRRRNLTGKWTRLLNGLRDSAASVIGSVGSLKGGSTVILSDQVRRGSSSIADEISGSVSNGNAQTTFVEVAAGTTGYVLVTELPLAPQTQASINPVEDGRK
ncbi:MAG: hypothetical protein WBO10_07135 [Pyrinomonadaceae bacterium]